MGLVGNWLQCWQKPDHESFSSAVVILEDDMEVAPVFWRWLKMMWGVYALRKDLAGISLQHQHTRASDGKPTFHVDNGDLPYMYKIPGLEHPVCGTRLWRCSWSLVRKQGEGCLTLTGAS